MPDLAADLTRLKVSVILAFGTPTSLAAKNATATIPIVVIRLGAVPPIAWAIGRLVGLEGIPLAVAVVQASTPTAVTAALWALEFDARPALVSRAVVLSTVVSVVTLTVLLAVLTMGP